MVEQFISDDSVYYTDRRRPVRADLDGRRDDGQPGERDMLVGIEHITGGSGRDRLTGNAKDNRLYSGNGADLLTGRAGNDTLDGDGDFPPGPIRTS